MQRRWAVYLQRGISPCEEGTIDNMYIRDEGEVSDTSWLSAMVCSRLAVTTDIGLAS